MRYFLDKEHRDVLAGNRELLERLRPTYAQRDSRREYAKIVSLFHDSFSFLSFFQVFL